jgi:hypothetical protein
VLFVQPFTDALACLGDVRLGNHLSVEGRPFTGSLTSRAVSSPYLAKMAAHAEMKSLGSFAASLGL